jgi:hypothetical protein
MKLWEVVGAYITWSCLVCTPRQEWLELSVEEDEVD